MYPAQIKFICEPQVKAAFFYSSADRIRYSDAYEAKTEVGLARKIKKAGVDLKQYEVDESTKSFFGDERNGNFYRLTYTMKLINNP